MKHSDPIGVFDSGVGGLTVVKQMVESLPGENIVYLGDTAHVPYGNKSARELTRLAENIINFLLERGAKVVVAACNTSSSVSLPILREFYDIPLLDVISPGASNAAAVTRNGRIGVIATQATVDSRAYTGRIKEIDARLEVFEVACPRFVPLVESGRLDDLEVEATAREYLEALQTSNIDTLVLGCTHYPFLAPIISRIMGERVTLVDPAGETVNQLKATLDELGVANRSPVPAVYEFFASGPIDSFHKISKMLPKPRIEVVKKVRLG